MEEEELPSEEDRESETEREKKDGDPGARAEGRESEIALLWTQVKPGLLTKASIDSIDKRLFDTQDGEEESDAIRYAHICRCPRTCEAQSYADVHV